MNCASVRPHRAASIAVVLFQNVCTYLSGHIVIHVLFLLEYEAHVFPLFLSLFYINTVKGIGEAGCRLDTKAIINHMGRISREEGYGVNFPV